MKLGTALKSVEIISKDYPSLKTDLNAIEIQKIAYHSSEVAPGTLFICIRGYHTDGHNYAEMAAGHGASALIVERYLTGLKIPQIKVTDSREALAIIAGNFYDQPSKNLRLFGVTGTNGKTTITYMTDALLRGYGLDTGLIGTVMIKSKDRIEKSVLTTPESADLQKYLANMIDEGVSHVSMEVSSSALDLKRVGQTHFDIVAFTNINHDHIDLHGSFESYFDAKASLIREASKESVALLNIDEPLLIPLINQTKAQVVTFGIENTSGTVNLSDIDISSGKPTFTFNLTEPLITLSGKKIDPFSFEIILTVPGYHSVYNATTAILTALLNDLPLYYVKLEIEKFKGVERRFHVLYDNEFTIIDDLLLNENNIDSSMKTVEDLNYKSFHIVHAIRGNNGLKLSRQNAEVMARWCHKLNIDKIILTASRLHVKEKDRVLKEELYTFLYSMEKAQIEVDFFEELEDALTLGLNRMEHGDLFLISGARGMDDGAKLCLELLMEMYPYVDQKAIRDVLKTKLVGMPSPADS
ncbi:Mur ligase family protein [Alkalibacterium sp. 20]|uniref:Mur ligase family protein n=1 Tax=Alkalibacterium sp. 20 TaxID=1798803 RepID=UPI0009004D55|nr:UDP-N-acetylmuramyl-tripeptide synthetase [Alkalibacterium sp. 20]OJF92189.1 UDP-N-acetylmuramoylalanyl-D-glutamate--2,6-diaminopimelate ligase [Alkalibacterium sp. 20]